MEYGLVVLWLATFFALGLVGLPLASVLCRPLADRGASVTLPLALSVVAVVALWVGRVSFGRPALAAGLVVLLGASAAAWRYGDAGPDPRIAGETAAVFAVAFLLLVAVRAVDPAVHPFAGEKFLDFGLLQSLLRAETLPPKDMWFAGEPVAYYYGGHLVSSLLTLLTGTAPAYAYNLALAGFYAMLVTAAFGLGGTLAAARGASRRVGGLFAAFLVGFASNLHTAGQLVLWVLPGGIAEPIARALAGSPDDAARLLAGPDGFHYFTPSRIIVDVLDERVYSTINEFPLFSWLNGDLHAHMMVQPFLLVVAALLLSYYRTPEEAVRRRRGLVFGVVPLVGGLIAVVDTWTFPTVMGLTVLALLFAPSDPATLLPADLAARVREFADASRAKAELARTGVAGVLGVGAEALAAVWALPFLLGPASTRSIGFFPPRSDLGELLVVHGAFLAVFAVYLVSRAPPLERDEWYQVGILVVGLLATAVVGNAAAVGLFGPLLVGGWALLRYGSREYRPVPGVGFETVLLVAGAGLVTIVEFAYVVEQAGPGRMNTVFKTYIQVWVLWGVAAGAMVAALVADAFRGDRSAWPWGALPGRKAATAVGVGLLLASTSVYGGMALSDQFDGQNGQYPAADDPTLNATRFVEEGHPGEAAAIRWLDDREGRPTIVTAAPGGYYWTPQDGRGASAPASLTGLPTVLGWYHEVGYRGSGPYQQRLADVETIYTGSAEEQAELLAKYDVEYVYVGPAERNRYGDVSFEGVEMVGQPKEFGDVLIYPVEAENEST
ncbi:hypothetical protein BRC81_11305 [Halobacteriales archaeon QS_1_68_20]|nr:MAG: hypothetical protein BRC81_11305 [Halobacteriales archaeon QS_1_68_20]